MIRNSLFIILILFLFLPLSSRATILYLEPTKGEYYQGDTFMTDIRINTEGECINTLEVNLIFSQELLKATDFSQGGSILTFWMRPPEISQESGLISFIGGIPGGYCGRLPGDPGESNLLGRVIFEIPGEAQVSAPSSAQVAFLDNSQVLLNDGLGTPAKLSTIGAVFTVLPGMPEISKQEWQEELKKDETVPEFFEIEISQDPSIFEGKYFIVFSTSDKQTGLDYFEIKEGSSDWQRAVSPYLLKDQSLQNAIKVKAVDKAGNERIAEYAPSQKKDSLFYLILILILTVACVIWWFARKNSKMKKLPGDKKNE